MHDGPGIRTTVFLKGCTLNCIWCHNPEANAFKPQLFFHAERCKLCGSCEAVCPNDVHHIINGEHFIDFNKCKTCGLCVQACDQKALKIVGTEMTVEMVMDQVLPDRRFYEKSGGGVTLSGGEPLAHINFAVDLLQAAKEHGLHTCLETSCLSSQKNLERILPVVDLFLIDYKATGDSVHEQYTGVNNELILTNLDFVYHQGKPIIIRCPIIPCRF
jgi:pyruvate formate lyase activating enzyme